MSESTTWHLSSWSELTRDAFHGIERLRLDVFVLEQDCVYSDLDGKDLRSLHVWAEDRRLDRGHAVAAYARLVSPGVSYQEPSIGRVVTRHDRRGEGLGRELMNRAIQACTDAWPNLGIRISAQCYLQGFYESLGFEPVGNPYLEDGLPHIQMLRSSRE